MVAVCHVKLIPSLVIINQKALNLIGMMVTIRKTIIMNFKMMVQHIIIVMIIMIVLITLANGLK